MNLKRNLERLCKLKKREKKMKKNKEPQKNVAHQHVSNESTRRREEGAETLFKDKRQKNF